MKKEKKATTVKKSRVEKPYNNGTFSHSMMMQFLRSALRKISMRWKPIAQVRKEAQVPYVGENKRRKYSYVCAKCGKHFASNDCAVHHLHAVGKLQSFEDLGEFAKNLFCEKQNLVLWCHICHAAHHSKPETDG
jgi:hypothetical protein